VGYFDERVRASWHCGWMDESEWTHPAQLPRTVGPVDYRAQGEAIDICPGWLVQQPAVAEAGMAYDAAEAGVLDQVYPEASLALVDAVVEMRRGLERFKAEIQRRASEKRHADGD